ncbi:IclR family transcriptional regulator [Sagittula sp. S175]|uniref:IclR family transcriptional regulator n=1 Tax=Sagittula sp. S175 TaxID=3415129 RepID=UPI003C7B3DE9
MGTITKALDLLDLFSSTHPEIGLGEFTRLTGRDKATVHRHLTELAENGFLEQHPLTRAYRLGPALLRLAAVREAAFPMRKLLHPIVAALAEDVGELAHASLLQGDALSPVVHADPKLHGVSVHFDESELLPLHATSSGLAVLAFGPDALRERVLARPLAHHTGQTVTDPTALKTLIVEVRKTGVARLEGAFDAEVTSQGVPLYGEGGVIGALSVAVPSIRAQPEKLAEIATRLRAAAQEASRSLGGPSPSHSRPLPHAARAAHP